MTGLLLERFKNNIALLKSGKAKIKLGKSFSIVFGNE